MTSRFVKDIWAKNFAKSGRFDLVDKVLGERSPAEGMRNFFAPIKDAGLSIAEGAVDTHNRFMDAGDQFTGLAKAGGEQAFNLAGETINDFKDAIFLDEAMADSLAKSQAKPKGMKDFFENMTPGQFVGLQGLSTGLQTAGALESIGSAEKATLNRMQQQYNLDLEDIEFQEWMGSNIRQIAEMESLVTELKSMESQVGGPVQSQMFINDPRSGVAL